MCLMVPITILLADHLKYKHMPSPWRSGWVGWGGGYWSYKGTFVLHAFICAHLLSKYMYPLNMCSLTCFHSHPPPFPTLCSHHVHSQHLQNFAISSILVYLFSWLQNVVKTDMIEIISDWRKVIFLLAYLPRILVFIPCYSSAAMDLDWLTFNENLNCQCDLNQTWQKWCFYRLHVICSGSVCQECSESVMHCGTDLSSLFLICGDRGQRCLDLSLNDR